MKEVLWCFIYVKEKTLGENYKVVYELWRERNPKTKDKCRCEIIFKSEKLYFKRIKNTSGRH
jgi:hypothetical protein